MSVGWNVEDLIKVSKRLDFVERVRDKFGELLCIVNLNIYIYV